MLDTDTADLLGGKGASVAETTNLGLPVPPGFVISTEACRTYLDAHLHDLERAWAARRVFVSGMNKNPISVHGFELLCKLMPTPSETGPERLVHCAGSHTSAGERQDQS